MKNFFLCILGTLLFTAYVWSHLFTALGFRLQTQDYSRWKYKLELINNKNHDFKTIIIGDSTTDAAIVSNLTKGGSLNISLGGSSTIDAYFMLKRYLKNNGKLSNLVIGFNSQSFENKELFYRHGLMLNMFTFNELFQLGSDLIDLSSLDSNNLGYPFIVVDVFKKLNLARYLYYYELLSIQLSLSNYQLDLVSNLFNESLYKLNYNKYIESKFNPNINLDVRNEVNDKASSRVVPRLIVNQLFNLYLLKILDLAKSNGISVYIIHPPVNKIYSNNTLLISSYLKYMNSLFLIHPEIHIYPNIEVYPAHFFKDSVHVDRLGSELFTKKLEKFITLK